MEKYTKIDLDEAIIHCQNKIKELKCGECKEEHRKLLEMLIDLKKYKEVKKWKSKNLKILKIY